MLIFQGSDSVVSVPLSRARARDLGSRFASIASSEHRFWASLEAQSEHQSVYRSVTSQLFLFSCLPVVWLLTIFRCVSCMFCLRERIFLFSFFHDNFILFHNDRLRPVFVFNNYVWFRSSRGAYLLEPRLSSSSFLQVSRAHVLFSTDLERILRV